MEGAGTGVAGTRVAGTRGPGGGGPRRALGRDRGVRGWSASRWRATASRGRSGAPGASRSSTSPRTATSISGALDSAGNGADRAEMPEAAPAGAQAVPAPAVLFVGTEKGFTYRLILTPVAGRPGAGADPQPGGVELGAPADDLRRPAHWRAGTAGPRGGAARAACRLCGPCRGRGRGHACPRIDGHRDLAGTAVLGARVRGRPFGVRRRGGRRGPRRDHRRTAGHRPHRGGRPSRRSLAGGARHRPLGRQAWGWRRSRISRPAIRATRETPDDRARPDRARRRVAPRETQPAGAVLRHRGGGC